MSMEIELCSTCLRIEKETGLTRDAEIRINPDNGSVIRNCECYKDSVFNVDEFLKKVDKRIEKEFRNGKF